MRLPIRAIVRSGFTLTELMVAAALGMVILLTTTLAFRSTSETVGVGQALAGTTRDARSAQAVFRGDCQTMLREDAPFILIQSRRLVRFVDANDEKEDTDGRPETLEIGGGSISAQQNALRNHRQDVLCFFTSSLSRMQTGTSTKLVSPLAARDAFVSYGHLRLSTPGNLDDPRNFAGPGEGTRANNPWNYDPAEWTLGRNVKLLSGQSRDLDGVAQIRVDRSANNNLPPMAQDSYADQEGDARLKPIQSSRHDLVLGSVQQSRTLIADAIRRDANYDWWTPFAYRFAANPFLRREANPARRADAIALAAPVFLRNCSSFSVEFAGDFITQQADFWSPATANRAAVKTPDGYVSLDDIKEPDCGLVTDSVPDGREDFVVVSTPNGLEMRTRWYGLPRDEDGDGVIRGIAPSGNANNLPDVLPISDVIRTGAGLASGYSVVERQRNFQAAADYATGTVLPLDAVYTVAFGPSDPKPAKVRLRITLRDPLKRLSDGQVFEYVYQLSR